MVSAIEPVGHGSPAFLEEERKLEEVVRYITEQHERLKGQMPATAAHHEAADAIQQILTQLGDNCTRPSIVPTFGRIDYFETGEPASPYGPRGRRRGGSRSSRGTAQDRLFGIAFIPGHEVYSWTAPVAKLWYTQSYEGRLHGAQGVHPHEGRPEALRAHS